MPTEYKKDNERWFEAITHSSFPTPFLPHQLSIISQPLVVLARNVSTTLVPYNATNNSSVLSGLLEM
jgi:hypothetical protein